AVVSGVELDVVGEAIDLPPVAGGQAPAGDVEPRRRRPEPQGAGQVETAGQPGGQAGGQGIAGAAMVDDLQRRRVDGQRFVVDQGQRRIAGPGDDDVV